jgi:hypothetical protein
MHGTAHGGRSSNYSSPASLRHEIFQEFRQHHLALPGRVSWRHLVQAATDFLFGKRCQDDTYGITKAEEGLWDNIKGSTKDCMATWEPSMLDTLFFSCGIELL